MFLELGNGPRIYKKAVLANGHEVGIDISAPPELTLRIAIADIYPDGGLEEIPVILRRFSFKGEVLGVYMEDGAKNQVETVLRRYDTKPKS